MDAASGAIAGIVNRFGDVTERIDHKVFAVSGIVDVKGTALFRFADGLRAFDDIATVVVLIARGDREPCRIHNGTDAPPNGVVFVRGGFGLRATRPFRHG